MLRTNGLTSPVSKPLSPCEMDAAEGVEEVRGLCEEGAGSVEDCTDLTQGLHSVMVSGAFISGLYEGEWGDDLSSRWPFE